MDSTIKLSDKTKRAITKYGEQNCIEAYRLNSKDGEGPSTIAQYLGLRGIQQANAAIDAGRELMEKLK